MKNNMCAANTFKIPYFSMASNLIWGFT